MRKCVSALAVTACAFTLAAASVAAPDAGRGKRTNPSGALVAAASALQAKQGGGAKGQGPKSVNVKVVGHSDLGGGGFNADVYSFGNYAYVGVWSGPVCPATGVKVVDISKPHKPALVSVLQNPAGTSAEDIVVQPVDTPFFTGDLAATGIQSCGGGPIGIQFFDVTDPRHPVELGFWSDPALLIGCHEIDLRSDGMAACANPFAFDAFGADEVLLVDATDPTAPTTVGTFGGIPTFPGDGCFGANFAHSVRFFGDTLYASYWDAGLQILDVSDPAAPALLGAVDTVPPDEDGDVHSMALFRDRYALINPEDFSPADEASGFCAPGDWNGWGDLQIWDVSNPAAPAFVSSFATPNAASKRIDGFYSIHNTEVFRGSQIVSSWYSDGIRVIDLTDVRRPREIGSFVPPATPDPHGFFPTVPLVWGVWPHGDKDRHVLASDINSGLWILQVSGPKK